jgi:hypothetical protein
MEEFKRFVLTCTAHEISKKRRALFQDINGDIFYPISLWPKKMERLFWRKPIRDDETFQLLLFLVGNGCPPDLSTEWILTSTYWDKTKTNSRFIQTRWILANAAQHSKIWFYFDMHLNKYVYLDGTDRLLHS